jgi:plasmid stabilization system protein ParE
MTERQFSIKLLQRAELELQESVLWYKKIDFDLAIKFIVELNNVFKYIKQNPLLFKKNKYQYHEAFLKTFPYIVIYKTYSKDNYVVITSVFHTKRNPKSKNIS